MNGSIGSVGVPSAQALLGVVLLFIVLGGSALFLQNRRRRGNKPLTYVVAGSCTFLVTWFVLQWVNR